MAGSEQADDRSNEAYELLAQIVGWQLSATRVQCSVECAMVVDRDLWPMIDARGANNRGMCSPAPEDNWRQLDSAVANIPLYIHQRQHHQDEPPNDHTDRC